IPVEPEGFEPSSPGCKPGILPLDDGPNSFCFTSVAGRTRTFILDLRRVVLDPVELPQRLQHISRPGRIRTCNIALLRSSPLPIWLLDHFACGPAKSDADQFIRLRRRVCPPLPQVFQELFEIDRLLVRLRRPSLLVLLLQREWTVVVRLAE